MADDLKSGNLYTVLHNTHKTGNERYYQNRSINIPGVGETEVKVPWMEGHYDGSVVLHNRILAAFDTFVEAKSYAGTEMKLKMADQIATNDVKRAFSRSDKEIILTFEDDNNDGFWLWSGLCNPTVANGAVLKIGADGQIIVSILKDHAVNKNWVAGRNDGRYDDEAVIEDLMVPGKTQPIYDSSPKAENPEGGEQFFRDIVKYFAEELSIEYDYEFEFDPTFNPNIHKGVQEFLKEYFKDLDKHIKEDGPNGSHMANFEKVIPILIEELGYGSDQVFESDGDIAKDIKQVRTLMKESLGLDENENLLTYLAGYYGLNEADLKCKRPEFVVSKLNKIFSKVRDLIKDSPDIDIALEDYNSAFAKAVKDNLDLEMPLEQIEARLLRHISHSGKFDEFKSDEIEKFLEEIGAKEKPDSQEAEEAERTATSPATSRQPDKPQVTIADTWFAQAKARSEDKSLDKYKRFAYKLIQTNAPDIKEYLDLFKDETIESKRESILDILKKSELGRETFPHSEDLEPAAKNAVEELFDS